MDRDLIRKKLSFIETCVRELREIARPDLIDSDIREARFVEHTLQIAVQAALDTAAHIVSARRLGEPRTNRALFDLLQKDGVIAPDLADALYAMVGFRNIVVHGYQDVDRVVVRDLLENHLDDLLSYVGCIRRHLDEG